MKNWIVGITIDPRTRKPRKLGEFESHDAAAEYISTLPNHEQGIYYIENTEEEG